MGLSNFQYDELMRDYDMRRQTNAAMTEIRMRKVYEALPRLSEIDDEIADAAMESFRKRLDNGADDGSLHDRIEALRTEKKRILIGGGYPEDYLEPVFDCRDCRDTGYIDGKRCHCFNQAAIRIMYGDSHLGDILEEENFESFSLDWYSKEIRDSSGQTSHEAANAAYDLARRFCEVGHFGDNLLIYGDPGVGKTCLTHCIAKEVLASYRSVIYVTSFSLTDIFSKRTFEKTEDAKKEFSDIFTCDLLIIDDLGTEFSNSFTQPMFFQCINERLLKKRSTVISTNLSLPMIKETYTERIFSRLVQHYEFVHLFGDDIRIKKKMMG